MWKKTTAIPVTFIVSLTGILFVLPIQLSLYKICFWSGIEIRSHVPPQMDTIWIQQSFTTSNNSKKRNSNNSFRYLNLQVHGKTQFIMNHLWKFRAQKSEASLLSKNVFQMKILHQKLFNLFYPCSLCKIHESFSESETSHCHCESYELTRHCCQGYDREMAKRTKISSFGIFR